MTLHLMAFVGAICLLMVLIIAFFEFLLTELGSYVTGIVMAAIFVSCIGVFLWTAWEAVVK